MFPWTVILCHKYPPENLEPTATAEKQKKFVLGMEEDWEEWIVMHRNEIMI